MAALKHFDEPTCREAVRIALHFWQLNGLLVPQRIHGLLAQLTVETFAGQPVTEQSRFDLCKRLEDGVRPWRDAMRGQV